MDHRLVGKCKSEVKRLLKCPTVASKRYIENANKY